MGFCDLENLKIFWPNFLNVLGANEQINITWPIFRVRGPKLRFLFKKRFFFCTIWVFQKNGGKKNFLDLRFWKKWIENSPSFILRVSDPKLDQNWGSYSVFKAKIGVQKRTKNGILGAKKGAKFKLEKEGLGIEKNYVYQKCREFPNSDHRIGFGISKLFPETVTGPKWAILAPKSPPKAREPQGGQKGDPPRGRLVKKIT